MGFIVVVVRLQRRREIGGWVQREGEVVHRRSREDEPGGGSQSLREVGAGRGGGERSHRWADQGRRR